MLILKSKIKHHISRSIQREKEMSARHERKALEAQQAHYENLLAMQESEYLAIIETCDRQIAAMKADKADDEKMLELIKFGAKSNNRIAADLVSWAERFLKTGANAYQEINCILDDAGHNLKRIAK